MKASDLIKKMENEPSYLAEKKKQEEDRLNKEKEIKILELLFIKDLHRRGYTQINQTSDLLLLKKADTRMVNLLLAWIPQISNKYNSQEMLIRGLAVAEEAFDSAPLIELFDKENSFMLKWAIANTIASTKVLNITTWLEQKLSSGHLGKESEMLIYAAIRYIPYDKSSEILRRLFDQFPLQTADAFSMVGKLSDIEYLESVAKKYRGVHLTQIKKSIKKLKKRLHK